MRLNTLLCTAVLLLLAACKGKITMTAKQYSDEIAQLEQSLAEPIRETENAIKRYADSADYKNVSVAAGKMETLIQQKIDQIEKVDVSTFTGGEDFKTVAVRYFEYFKSLYTAYREIGDAPDEAARITASNRMNQVLVAQEEVILRLQDTQVRFAAENGFMLEKAPLQQTNVTPSGKGDSAGD
ncbi:hypothetical protein [Niabella drilacis]|uniref:DUF4142 domain-containing protein n=1 Tax=Niabella drilacis (strain DSM 25811 / CCM 8410 / CCUG 62505 / LMG 26954 / E90) TaxID=1285928 RepID=A0A1G7A1H0_NIADE|nr:hypothetical protein [Niabella drilacis]SDE08672.1 hypothetical protein SAMN04487894_12054 [Niabella drilacis]